MLDVQRSTFGPSDRLGLVSRADWAYAPRHRSLQYLARSNDAFEEQFWYVPHAFLEAQAYEALGDKPKARASYEEARRLLARSLAAGTDDSRCHSALGLVLAALGDVAGAVREGQAGVDGMPVMREAYRGVYRLEDLARIYARTGQPDQAVYDSAHRRQVERLETSVFAERRWEDNVRRPRGAVREPEA